MRTRRDEVIHLLLVGSAAKLEVGMTLEAGRLLERALRKSLEPEPLPGPWSALAAYRLALVELRRDLDPAQLERVLGLLDQAASSEMLGPWPALYRLAAMSRLGTSREALVDGMQRVQQLLRAEPRARSHGEWGLLGATAGGRAETMLEFYGLCHGIGIEVERDRRRTSSAPAAEEFRWMLVGPAVGLRTPMLPRSLAVAEFEAYQASMAGTEQLYFALPAQGTAWMSLAGGEPEPSHPQGLRLLTRLLNERPMPSDELRRLVVGPDAGTAAWDKARSRLNKRLGAMLGMRGSASILQDGQGRWVLSPTLCVLGLVDKAALDPAVRRRGRGGWRDDERPIGYRKNSS